MEAKRDDGLTAKQARFAALLARGYTQSAAYREAYDADDMKPETLYPAASKLAADYNVRTRVNELLQEVRLEDLDNCRAALLDLLSDMDAARQAGNWSAVAALTRLRLQALGMLKDKLVVSGDAASLSDKQLIDELAGNDPAKRKIVAEMIGYREGELG
ncbi:MAG: hypothetical protein OEU49_14565 [Chromatiales bacterium]|nr:hypothetical protein [Chromatiales bacterium]